MKANAPEKLYLFDYNEAMVTPLEGDTVYVREDAFIEKAFMYLNDKFYFNNLHYAIENNSFNCMEEMYDDFKKYMEGE